VAVSSIIQRVESFVADKGNGVIRDAARSATWCVAFNIDFSCKLATKIYLFYILNRVDEMKNISKI
jgi:hypothetical protein